MSNIFILLIHTWVKLTLHGQHLFHDALLQPTRSPVLYSLLVPCHLLWPPPAFPLQARKRCILIDEILCTINYVTSYLHLQILLLADRFESILDCLPPPSGINHTSNLHIFLILMRTEILIKMVFKGIHIVQSNLCKARNV